jgi:hypothetical protein
MGAALVAFVLSSTTQRMRAGETPSAPASIAAGPQVATLGWREAHGPPGEQLLFAVESLTVLERGWRARLSIENRTSVPYEIGDPKATLDRSFGLMLFASGERRELESRRAEGRLPAVRPAATYEPELPLVLQPGESWEGVMSASGALVASSWVRVVFGALVSVGKPPPGLKEHVVWITRHAHRLER